MSPLVFALLLAGNDPDVVTLSGWKGGERVPFAASEVPGSDLDGRRLFLRVEAARAFQDLLEHALRSGVLLEPTYAHRTYAQQQRLHRRSPRKAARPGYSDHQQGLSIDLANTTHRGRPTRLYRWLQREAPRFGFYNNVPGEPWHWTWRE